MKLKRCSSSRGITMIQSSLVSHVLLVVLLVSVQGQTHDFGYDGNEGPRYWGQKYQQCVGKHQSPINIEEHEVQLVNLFPILYQNFDKKPSAAILKNNGHTVMLTLETEYKPMVTGGPLFGNYEFAQLHFHWGSHDSEGSETTINNSSFPMELHIVFFSSSYGTFQEATEHPDGLTVLSFLISKSPEPNTNYNPLIEALKSVTKVDSSTKIDDIPPLEDLLVSNRSVYFTYGGSLTTPPCSEVVTWIEYKHTIPLSQEQIQIFRQIESEHGKLSHNFRPTQPLYGRVIRMNRDVDLETHRYQIVPEQGRDVSSNLRPQFLLYSILLISVFLHIGYQ